MAQRSGAEQTLEIVGHLQAHELGGPHGLVVAELAGAVERVGQRARQIVEATVVGPRQVDAELGDAGVVELLVREDRPGVAIDAGSLADEQPEAALGGGRQRAVLALDVAVDRRVAADQLALVGLDCLSGVGHDRVDDVAILGVHHLPGTVRRHRVGLGLALRREPRGVGRVRIERGIEGKREDRVVVVAILPVQHVGVLEPVAAEVDRALAAVGALVPQRVLLAAPAHPLVVGDVDQGRRVARRPGDAERRRVGMGPRVGVVVGDVVAARARDLAGVTDRAERGVGDRERVRVGLLEEQPLPERGARRVVGVAVGRVRRRLTERPELPDHVELLLRELVDHLVAHAPGEGQRGHDNIAQVRTHISPWGEWYYFAIRLVEPSRYASQ